MRSRNIKTGCPAVGITHETTCVAEVCNRSYCGLLINAEGRKELLLLLLLLYVRHWLGRGLQVHEVVLVP